MTHYQQPRGALITVSLVALVAFLWSWRDHGFLATLAAAGLMALLGAVAWAAASR